MVQTFMAAIILTILAGLIFFFTGQALGVDMLNMVFLVTTEVLGATVAILLLKIAIEGLD